MVVSLSSILTPLHLQLNKSQFTLNYCFYYLKQDTITILQVYHKATN